MNLNIVTIYEFKLDLIKNIQLGKAFSLFSKHLIIEKRKILTIMDIMSLHTFFFKSILLKMVLDKLIMSNFPKFLNK